MPRLSLTTVLLIGSLVLAAFTGYTGYQLGYDASELKWSKAYLVGANNYIDDSAKKAQAAESKLEKIRKERQVKELKVKEAKDVLATTPAVAVFSDDELRALANLRASYADRP